MSTHVRVYVALAGFLLAMLGLVRDDRRITGAAIVVLAVALFLRFAIRPPAPPPES